ncbi:MAG TPA: family 20 glycosylhydrolase [Niabella sp.]|nr:family 20 glycosylhydrolase [Niabella sp.]
MVTLMTLLFLALFNRKKLKTLKIVKKYFSILLVMGCNFWFATHSFSQNGQLPSWPDTLFSTYWHQQTTLFKNLPQTKGDIIFLGNSITDGGEWQELFGDSRIKNRGISADVTIGVLNRLKEITDRKPDKIFLMIGTNDLSKGISTDSVVKNILEIVKFTHLLSPATKVYVQSILPVNPGSDKFKNHTGNTPKIKAVNRQLELYAKKHQFTYVNLFDSFINSEGYLNRRYSNDGLHLLGDGYMLWKHLVFPYIYDAGERPALIPAPVQLSWKQGAFPLYQCKTILVTQPGLEKEAKHLQKLIRQKGYQAEIKSKVKKDKIYIELKLNTAKKESNNEAYQLSVTDNKVLIYGNAAHGVFNGIQTLWQLARDGALIDNCQINDEPAYSMRGYMVDVGRNYMSMELLKQQIDAMAQYKLNVFHFHGTEDIAWRFASKMYPQLTAGENMIRNKGFFYSEQELQELINYCADRHIILIPEIDMPGHSAAFRRAMGVDMQSDSGMMYVKNIVNEFLDTYKIHYLHIGGDEVKITNKNFLPEMIQLVQSRGVKTIGWSPGGNLDEKTYRQLWMEDFTEAEKSHAPLIDSRHLYLNHMDPFEGVTTIFNRQIGNRIKGDDQMLGAILCLWPDRRVEKEEDAIRMNLVYPGMLAFAERTWKGGGVQGWVANIGSPGEKRVSDFAEFENRLLVHKNLYFKKKPFPYFAQQDIKWNLYGPYDNGGDLTKKFEPEFKSFNPAKTKPYKEEIGATIILRHWWAPQIKGAIDEVAKENTTWYATRRIWSDDEGFKNVWIGFYNISRSQDSDTPPAGEWDYKKSAVWVNGNLIAPPLWKHAGQKGNMEIPLIDEGYELRKPTKIYLQKGWNDVLIKAPVGSFKGKNWQNPVKWMFTFVEVK